MYYIMYRENIGLVKYPTEITVFEVSRTQNDDLKYIYVVLSRIVKLVGQVCSNLHTHCRNRQKVNWKNTNIKIKLHFG